MYPLFERWAKLRDLLNMETHLCLKRYHIPEFCKLDATIFFFLPDSAVLDCI